MKLYYKKYCKVLTKVTVADKRMAYDNHIKKSHNIMRTACKIITTETGRNKKEDHAQYLIVKYNDQNVTQMLNNHF